MSAITYARYIGCRTRRYRRRQLAFATTSTWGATNEFAVELMCLQSLLTLDTKLPGDHCLTHVGREGGATASICRVLAPHLPRSVRQRGAGGLGKSYGRTCPLQRVSLGAYGHDSRI